MAIIPPGADRSILSRRSMLLLTGGLATYGFFGCGDDEVAANPELIPPSGDAGDASDAAPVATSAAFFEQLMKLREAVRKSPDHTRARAELAVASKDADLIFRFVRDEIALLAPHGAGEGVAQRWGAEGVLRGGAGTHRERAELLASLLGRAGIPATVGLAALPAPIAPEVLYRRPARVFAPAIDDAGVDAFWAAIGAPTPTPTPFDADGNDSKKLAAELLALVPGAKAAVLQLAGSGLVPMLTLTVGGKPKLAFPYGNLELIDPVPSIVVSPAPTPQAPTPVRLVFSMTTALGERSLLEATYGADALVGKQLLLRMVPPVEAPASLALRSDDVHLFVPTMALSSPGIDGKILAGSVKTGGAVTDRGDVVTEDATGVFVNGVPASPAAGGADGAAVATVTVVANAAAFPAIELLVSAADGAGKAVPTLAASAFRISEDGAERGFVITENATPKKRVLVIYDSSVSIPQAFYEDAGKTSFGQALAQALGDRFPDVELLAMPTTGDNPVPALWSHPTPDAFGESVRALPAGGSNVWTALRNAALASPAVIVCLSDFVADEQTDPNLQSIKATAPFGAPVVAVGVATLDVAVQTEIAALTGGVVLTTDAPTNVTAIVEAVAAILSKRAAAPYRISYRAPADGATTRQVTVAVPKSSAKGPASYVVPAMAKRLPEGGILGLSLSVQLGEEPPIKRTLAGLAPDQAALNVPLTAALSAQIREALIGIVALSVEGGAPSTATWIDDALTGRLSTRPLVEAIEARDPARVLAALEAGFAMLPEGLDALHTPPAVASPGEAVVMEQGLRAVLYRVSRRADGARMVSSDILQSTRLESTSADAGAAFKQTLEASCRFALAEGALFDTSTVSLLRQVPLTRVPSFTAPDLSFMPEAGRPAWNRLLAQYAAFDRLVPTSGGPLAMWAIDPTTGTVFGVLDDGGGKGRTAALPPGAIDEKTFDNFVRAAGFLGGGPYLAVGAACVRIFIRTHNELIPGYVGPPVDVAKEACNLVLGVATGGLLKSAGSIGSAIGKAQTLSQAAGAPSLTGC